jgi:hypothetical protein
MQTTGVGGSIKVMMVTESGLLIALRCVHQHCAYGGTTKSYLRAKYANGAFLPDSSVLQAGD